jgi:hypothetical protein
MDHVPPDMLHCFLGVMKKFVSLVAGECLGDEEAENEFEKMYKEANIKIYSKKKNRKVKI